jgi:hypothetical protein
LTAHVFQAKPDLSARHSWTRVEVFATQPLKVRPPVLFILREKGLNLAARIFLKNGEAS